jgi:hypothetical protein
MDKKDMKKAGKTMNATIDNIMGKEGKSYRCHICNKTSKNSVDAITHMIDHSSSALEAINAMIKDQKGGKVSNDDRQEAKNKR